MPRLVSPSLLAADFLHLEKEIEMINKSQADWLHLDIMDGVFVPNISYGIPVLESIKPLLKKPMDVHLMIVDPDRYVEVFRKAGAEILTVHYEACPHLHRTIQHIKDNGMKAGVSLNPHTPVSLLKNIINDVDMVLLMSVNPGFGGQKFIENTYNKVIELRKMIEQQGASTIIQIDGGVDSTNAKALYDAGADCLVAGSAVFRSKDPLLAIEGLKNA
ncbi:ribulose-phosphate 3-epimerase [Acetobacteroides hydrogenigenes]|uniref:Ribulose-phosphate 3-epimerase n=1 Tax=Acetobacteroides hydrogenigenes TaxID=979970 RepID=A0A4R2EAD2_9BACT|nr:ribulose-phosphate 3-epimerase [Acetobacteroides hydrogenigenes]TCN65678.1 ribulose-phosphate 3-epimerase [Acetobacteroides hydrogenigenes]